MAMLGPWLPRKSTGSGNMASNKRILLLLRSSVSPFVLSRSFSRGSSNDGENHLSVHASLLVDWQLANSRARAIDPLAFTRSCTSSTLIQIPNQACVCVRCSRCDHPVVTDGVFPAGGPHVDANLRGGANYRYRSTFPTYTPSC